MFSDSKIAIVNTFGDVVKSLRKTDIITSVQLVAGTTNIFKITAPNSLLENEPVEIEGKDYLAFEVTDHNFKVLSIDGVIGGDNKPYYAKAPYYEHGHFLEIANKLTEKDAATLLYKYQKYPLIALIQDFPERRQTLKPTEASLNILIITYTEQSYSSADRYVNTIIPILYPLYDSLLKALKASRTFGGTFDHTKIDRVNWGTQRPYFNESLILNDYVDAIELQDLQVQIINSPC